MGKKLCFYIFVLLVSLSIFVPFSQGDDLKLFSIQNTRNALELYSESEIEDREIASATLPTRRSRLLLSENLETDFKGYIYHPNFAAFEIDLKNGLKQNREKFPPALNGKLKNSPLNYFHILGSFLNKKPYAFSLLADKSREVQNREFFERQIISSTKYGGNFGLRNDFAPIGFSFSSSEKKIDRLSRPSQNFRDDELSFNLSNESKLGQTFVDTSQDKFSRTEVGVAQQKGTSRNFNLSNQKYFSDNDKSLLRSSLYLYDLSGMRKSRVLNFNENLNIKHTDYLDTTYAYSFSDKSSSGIKTKDNRWSAALRHRLYESLTSTMSPYYFKSEGTAFSQEAYGLSLDENYVKKLGTIGSLNLGVGLNYSEEKRKAPDTIIPIIDESYTLTSGVITLLAKPRVDLSTVVVTDSSGTTMFTADIDYQLIQVGELTQIQRLPGGSIANGQSVLIDYQAKSNPSLEFNTWLKNFRFRVEFFDRLFGLFYNVARETHPRISGEDGIILQTLTDTIRGIDFNYKNLGLEFMQENFDSNLSPYKQWRIRESLFFNPSQTSALTFQSSQNMVELISTGTRQKFFDLLGRYSLGLNMFSRVNVEGGFRRQRGAGVDLDDTTAGCGYDVNFSKFIMNVKYDFKKQLFLGDKLINHFFSVGVKRIF